MWQNGILSSEEFYQQLEDFVQIAQKSGDVWKVETAKQGNTVVQYLVKHAVYPGNIRGTHCVAQTTGPAGLTDDSALTLAQDIEAEDECTLRGTSVSQHLDYMKYEFHVVYSPSYSVPVLYFTASKPDGHLVSLDEIWFNIPEVHQARLEQERWTFLTQQEHPLLCRPFYQLHPCHTQDFMKRALTCCEPQRKGHVNYLVTWLSTVGPIVGLHLPLEFSAQGPQITGNTTNKNIAIL